TADLAAIMGAIAYDIGETPLVNHAIEHLHRASAVLLAAGDAVRAASLANDEAALHMRFGATARASELLARSRDLLLAARQADPAARRELAMTEHLRARLPLHDERPGVNRALLLDSLQHAEASHRTFAELGQRRSAARVFETMGRLELLA